MIRHRALLDSAAGGPQDRWRLPGLLAAAQDLLRTPLWEWTAAALGLVVGSFANVCIHRVPLRQSVGAPPSRCPACGAGIRPWDNVPVLSYLLLRGRCRACGVRISPRYPLVESANAVAYWLIAVHYGATAAAGVAMALVTALLVLSLIDLDHQILPDVVTRPGIAAGIASSLALHSVWGPPPAAAGGVLGGSWRWDAPLAALAGYAVFAAIAAAGRRYYGQEALGRGDWKLAALLGSFLGLKGLFLTVFLASLAGAAVGLAFIALKKATRLTPIPFGTFLGLAGIVVVLAGGEIWRWYGTRFGLVEA
jgi:leader peptidase (prepilin peptidase)/N-methyltransferase